MASKSWIRPILLLTLSAGVAFAQARPPKVVPKAPLPPSSTASDHGMMGSGMMSHG